MAKINKLSVFKVSTTKEPGRFADGGGLYLQVTPSGNKSWLYRYRIGDKQYAMGLGPVMTVSLSEARDKARDMRAMRLGGNDPLAAKREAQATAHAQQLHSKTFAQCVDAYLDQHSSGWRNDRHRKQWRSTLNRAVKEFGSLDVRLIDTAMIVGLLTPIWKKTPETGSRLRGRIEKVLDWASAVELREGENPARWKGHLQHVLKARPKSEHHAAMPWGQVPAFMEQLRMRDSMSARALEFLILTASRTGEVIGMRWEEIDFAAKVWTVPAERMKAKTEHRVPLTDRAIEILKGLQRLLREPRADELIFPLSNMALLQMLRGMDANGFTTHGFRSAFRDWCGERTNFARDIIEFALAHKLPNKVEAAYRRETAVEKRRALMQAWAKYCASPSIPAGEVVSLRA